jgi:hypothetical protein
MRLGNRSLEVALQSVRFSLLNVHPGCIHLKPGLLEDAMMNTRYHNVSRSLSLSFITLGVNLDAAMDALIKKRAELDDKKLRYHLNSKRIGAVERSKTPSTTLPSECTDCLELSALLEERV